VLLDALETENIEWLRGVVASEREPLVKVANVSDGHDTASGHFADSAHLLAAVDVMTSHIARPP
jgi:hypothetical protein